MSKRKTASSPEPVAPASSDNKMSPNEPQEKEGFDDEGVRAWYKRLAQEYLDNEPIVPDCGGGVSGDLYDL